MTRGGPDTELRIARFYRACDKEQKRILREAFWYAFMCKGRLPAWVAWLTVAAASVDLFDFLDMGVL